MAGNSDTERDRLVRVETQIANINAVLQGISGYMENGNILRAQNQTTLALIAKKQEDESDYRARCDRERAKNTADIAALQTEQNKLRWTAAAVSATVAFIFSGIATIAGLYFEYIKKG